MRVDVGDLTLFVDIEGPELVPDGAVMSKKHSLVLVHGGPGFDHTLFKPDFTCLSDLAQIVYIDGRGQGRSDHGEKDRWTRDVWADDIRRVCDVLGIDRPLVCGHSFGGVIAQSYAIRHPDHLAGLVLVATTAHWDVERSADGFRRVGGEMAARAFLRLWRDGDPEGFPDFVEHCAPLYGPWTPGPAERARVVMNPELLASAHHHFRDLDLRAQLADVRCPVLTLAGDVDPICRVADAREITEAVPAPVAHEVLHDAGHFAWKDRPDAFWPLLRDFIQKC